jgi:hypothetical protein
MKLPVGIIQASLEMVRSRIAAAFPSEAVVVAEVIDALNPSSNALRQRRHRAKPVTQTSVTCNASGNAEVTADEPPCASRAASESPSPPKSAEILQGEEKREAEEIESACATRNAPSNARRNASVTPKVTPRKWTRVPADFVVSPDAVTLAGTLGVDLAGELAKFRDHEFAKPKTDADAAFRTWLRNASQWSAPARPANGNGRQRGPAPVSPASEFDDMLREQRGGGHA